MNRPYFVHATDMHMVIDKAWECLEAFVEQIGQMNPMPAFVVNTGDTAPGSLQIPSDPDELRGVYKRYAEIMKKLPVPLYNVMGNHDTTGSPRPIETIGWGKELFEEYFGPRYQSFDWEGWHFVGLDQFIWKRKTADEPGKPGYSMTGDIDDEQLAWLKDDLKKCSPGQTVLIMVHHRLPDHVVSMEKIKSVLRDDLRYVELAGCDHQSSFHAGDNWESYTTGSFCGAWWAGPCIDLTERGYALFFPDDNPLERHFYRPMEGSLAIAQPTTHQIIGDSVVTDAIDPATGRREKRTVDTRHWSAGWNELTVKVGEKKQPLPVFCKPTPKPVETLIGARFEFELFKLDGSCVEVMCGGRVVGTFHLADEGQVCCSSLDPTLLDDWVQIRVVGDALIRSPRIVFADRVVHDPRVQRFESVRPLWFGEGLQIKWDVSGTTARSPFQSPENAFYFHCWEA